MTLDEIMNIIKEEKLEADVYHELHMWMIYDRAGWLDRACLAEKAVRDIGKIAYGKSTKDDKIKSIKEICLDECKRHLD